MTYAERAKQDPELANFVAAEIARAWVEFSAAKVELEHARVVIADQKRQITELEASARAKGKK